MYRAGPVAQTGPAVARERPRADPDFGGSNRREETATDFLKWDTAQPGAKLAAMSNKSKSQPQQQQQPQHQQQQHHPSHVIKSVDQLPPRYQPPPQPTSGILKNHLHFANGITSAPNSGQAGNSQGPGAALNHQQSTQPRTLPPPSTLQHHPQQQHQPQLTQSQQQVQQQAPKDAQSKYSPRIEHHHHYSQPGNALIAAASVATSKSQQQQQQPPTYFQQTKLGQSSYLPPSSQYPAVNSGQSAPIRQRISDDEFLRLGPVEMLKFVRKTESDIARLAAEQNRQIQSLVSSFAKFSASVND